MSECLSELLCLNFVSEFCLNVRFPLFYSVSVDSDMSEFRLNFCLCLNFCLNFEFLSACLSEFCLSFGEQRNKTPKIVMKLQIEDGK